MFFGVNKLPRLADKPTTDPLGVSLIRDMHPADLSVVCELLRQFRELSPIPIMRTLNNEGFIRKQLRKIISGEGVAKVAVVNREIVGIIVGVITTTFWDPDLLAIKEVVFYTLPTHRKSRIGFKLFKEYEKACIELRNKHIVSMIILSDMGAALDYSRFNYKIIDRDWIYEG
jgi:hypothetical protein